MHEGKGRTFVRREEFSYVVSLIFSIASCNISRQDRNLKVSGAALKQLLVTFYSITFRYPGIQMNLH